MATPVPIALCGKNLQVAEVFSNLMLPEFEVVHVCQSTTSAVSELPALLQGATIKPASGVGSNMQHSKPKVPQAIFVGGGWSKADVDVMRSSDAIMTSVPFVCPGEAFMAAQTSPPAVEVIVANVRRVFAEQGLAEGSMDKSVFNF